MRAFSSWKSGSSCGAADGFSARGCAAAAAPFLSTAAGTPAAADQMRRCRYRQHRRYGQQHGRRLLVRRASKFQHANEKHREDRARKVAAMRACGTADAVL